MAWITCVWIRVTRTPLIRIAIITVLVTATAIAVILKNGYGKEDELILENTTGCLK